MRFLPDIQSDRLLVLGQSKVHDKSNEITAIPALLEQLSLEGNIVTIDAMGTQHKIAAMIREKNGDYILALKRNQSSLHDDVIRFFQNKELAATCVTHKTLDFGHGRIEERTICVTGDIQWLCEMHPHWKSLNSIIAIMSVREIKKTGVKTTDTRYYISSLPPDPVLLLRAIRAHWRIENTLHWSLDVIFREDDSRLRQGNAAANMAVIRKVAFNVLRQEPSEMAIKLIRVKAAHDRGFRSALICVNHS